MKPSHLLHRALLYTVTATAIILTGGCQYLHTKPAQNIEYLPLGDYKYTPAQVDSGTALRIIACSGGKASDKEHIYYCQFITVNTSNGDTIRVLSSLINYDLPGQETPNSYTSADMYDGRKRITDATFMPADSNQAILLNVTEEAENIKNNTVNINDLSKLTRPQFVTINKSLPELQTPSWKTIIGVLHFKEIPW